jgi:plasmid stability protein
MVKGKSDAKQYTIRNIPAELDAALRHRARAEGRSLNDVAVDALLRGAGLTKNAPRARDLSDVAGTWEPDPGFDEAVEEMDRVDPEMWP